jgi:hypothetical protein
MMQLSRRIGFIRNYAFSPTRNLFGLHGKPLSNIATYELEIAMPVGNRAVVDAFYRNAATETKRTG